MPEDHPAIKVEVIWPTKEERDKRLEEVERYTPHWSASQALLIIKPDLGLIVSVKRIEHDEHYLRLTVKVEESICVWNQPYLSLSANGSSAPYGFCLHFGTDGVRQVRKFSASKNFHSLQHTEMILEVLRRCFSMSPHQLKTFLSDDIG